MILKSKTVHYIDELPSTVYIPNGYSRPPIFYCGTPVEIVCSIASETDSTLTAGEAIDYLIIRFQERARMTISLPPNLTEENRAAVFVALLLSSGMVKAAARA